MLNVQLERSLQLQHAFKLHSQQRITDAVFSPLVIAVFKALFTRLYLKKQFQHRFQPSS
ncbi:hypothetical protein L917_02573 [Phytophthora nicotianae]|uniref:Uncharacterized protein n=1 Tax=Phytophthora nicotianae TaxID=4792 RepID=W2LTN3_PHYNI|nr:hypothetical protein L917_02573 [Phytophthora nicotianae]